MKAIDFTNCELAYKVYGGAERKMGIIYDSSIYMLKFPKKTDTTMRLDLSYTNSIFSEYLGSHILQTLGITSQDTILGQYGDKQVVACKDFVSEHPGYELYEFEKFKGTHIESITSNTGNSSTELSEIIETIEKHDLIKNPSQVKAWFWDLFVADALIGNFDRHNGNWGFLINSLKRDVQLAPAYDCGSALYSRLSDEEIEKVLHDPNEIRIRIYNKPNSAIKICNTRINYYEYLSKHQNPDCNDALIRISKKINLDVINRIIDETPFLSDIRKQFYKTMLKERKEKIIDYSVKKLLKSSK